MEKEISTPSNSAEASAAKRTLLVTGASGQLGQCFQQLASDYPEWQFLYTDFQGLDITNQKAVYAFFQKNDIHWCINCAAYAAVDKAESEPDLAQKVNVDGARNLALACAEQEIPLFHFSTDYVYNGQQNVPFREGDPEHPQGVYASTKLAGDQAVLKANAQAVVVRTSWLYAAHSHNFVRSMLQYGAERPVLNVVYDQVGTPTYAPDLAQAVLSIIQKVEQKNIQPEVLAGVWHYSNEGVCSWYDFAKAIMDMSGLSCQVKPIETKDYPLPAPRPAYSVLNKEKFKAAFGLEIPYWRDSLQRCLTALSMT